MTEFMWSITIGLFAGFICYVPLHWLLKEDALKMPIPMAVICWFYGDFLTTLLFGVMGHILGYSTFRMLDLEKKTNDELLQAPESETEQTVESLPFREDAEKQE